VHLNAKHFSAHEAHRLHTLDGLPLASFGSRAIAFALDLVVFNLAVAAVSIAWTSIRPSATGGVQVVSHQTWWALAALVAYFGFAKTLGINIGSGFVEEALDRAFAFIARSLGR